MNMPKRRMKGELGLLHGAPTSPRRPSSRDANATLGRFRNRSPTTRRERASARLHRGARPVTARADPGTRVLSYAPGGSSRRLSGRRALGGRGGGRLHDAKEMRSAESPRFEYAIVNARALGAALIGKSRRSNVRPIEKARKALDRSRRRCTGQRKRPIVPRAQFLYARAYMGNEIGR